MFRPRPARRLSPAGLALLALSASVPLAAGQDLRPDPADRDAALARLLARAPADAPVVVAVDVSDLWKNPQLGPLAATLKNPGPVADLLRDGLGVGIEGVERIVLYAPRRTIAGLNPGEPLVAPGLPVLLADLVEPSTAEDGEGRLTLSGGRTRAVNLGLTGDAPFAELVDPASGPPPPGSLRALAADLLSRDGGADLIVLADVAALRPGLRPRLSDPPTGSELAVTGLARPLAEHADRLALVASLSDGTLRIVAESPDPDAAETVRATLEASVTLARNLLAPTAPAGPDRETLDRLAGTTWGRLAGVGRGLLTNATVVADGTRTTLTLPGDETIGGSGDLAAGLASLLSALGRADAAADRSGAMNDLKQIALGLHNYHQMHGRFPPAVIEENGVQRSWRVELLPYLDEDELWEAYRKDEPWHSRANSAVTDSIPDVYRHPADDRDRSFTAYFAPLAAPAKAAETGAAETGAGGAKPGPATLWNATAPGSRFRDITDGTAYTLLVVEAKRPVPWTKPEDLTLDLSGPLDPTQLGGFVPRVFLAAFADGSVRAFQTDLAPARLRALLTRNGNETVDPAAD